MNKLMQLKNKKGFTLVELIVVIVIIAVLAAVAVPMMMKYVNDAKESSKKAAVDVMTTAAAAALSKVASDGTATTALIETEMKALLSDKKYTLATSGAVITATLVGTSKTIVITFDDATDTKQIVSVVTDGTGW